MAAGIKTTAGAVNNTTVTLGVTSFKGTMMIALAPELSPTITADSPAD